MEMDIRLQMFWLREADARDRNKMALIAQAVNMGMASGADFKRALDELELRVSKQEQHEGFWELMELKQLAQRRLKG